MTSENLSIRTADSAPWQDYRASDTGMVVFYGTDPVSELPIREIPEKYPSEIETEPNYESGTFGFHSCARMKIRSTFVKSRVRYMIFITKYAGTSEEHKGKYFVTGYYRITKIADVKKHHIRTCADYSCLDEKTCHALHAGEAYFVSIEDAYPVSMQMLKDWEFSGRLTRQSRIFLNEQQTAGVIEFLKKKKNILDKYIEETMRLQPETAAVEDDEGDDDGGDDSDES